MVDVKGNSMKYVHDNNASLRPIYCMYHGKALSYKETLSGKYVKWAKYLSTSEDGKIEESVGYAFFYGNTSYGSGWTDDETNRKAMQRNVFGENKSNEYDIK
jgi:hypothetical protein